MKIYFYYTVPISEYLDLWQKGKLPGHALYGITEFTKYGIDYIYHKYDISMSRLKLSIYNFYRIFFSQNKYDAVYAVTFRGLELIILLRALGLFRKPIVLWHHTAVIVPKNRLRRYLSSLFYRGIDKMFFFSEYLMQRSLETKKVKSENAFVIPWGADLKFYDYLIEKDHLHNNIFISTGIEHRDFETLIQSFIGSNAQIKIYVKNWLKPELDKIVNSVGLKSNIELNYGDWSLEECAHYVNDAKIVAICCKEYPYTIGLTTLVEALALGKPLLITKNVTYPFDVEEEGVGIKIEHSDKQGWIEAINYLKNNPEVVSQMQVKSRKLAENRYNLSLFTEKIIDVLQSLNKR